MNNLKCHQCRRAIIRSDGQIQCPFDNMVYMKSNEECSHSAELAELNAVTCFYRAQGYWRSKNEFVMEWFDPNDDADFFFCVEFHTNTATFIFSKVCTTYLENISSALSVEEKAAIIQKTLSLMLGAFGL